MSSRTQEAAQPTKDDIEYEILSFNVQAIKDQAHAAITDPAEASIQKEQSLLEPALQLTKDSIGSAAHISGDQLTFLLTTIEKLQDEVTTLKVNTKALIIENAKVTENLRDLERLYGCNTFRFFPKLPLELRTMIWQLALYTPEIFGLVEGPLRRDLHMFESSNIGYNIDHAIPLIPHPQMRSVCQEARRVALRADCLFMGVLSPLKRPIFCNKDVDTFFFITRRTQLRVISLLKHLEYANLPIKKFACRFKEWDILKCDRNCLGFALEGLSKTHTEEVILVVGDEEAYDNPDVIFVPPTKSPYEMISTKYPSRVHTGISPATSWPEVEERLMKPIGEYNTRRKKRVQNLANGGDTFWPKYCCSPLETWKVTVKKLTYMEATTAKALKIKQKA
ncbi:hypothetical protein VTL71DRAFT_11724 [Oculimacula yallundae]|uniref:2EXR domain-containing protein n=1 Tax=Oculimacula yallundae TaxID=86028 RepID=A0ABR4CSK3_9HELO